MADDEDTLLSASPTCSDCSRAMEASTPDDAYAGKGFSCDVCAAPGVHGAERWYCEACSSDVCFACVPRRPPPGITYVLAPPASYGYHAKQSCVRRLVMYVTLTLTGIALLLIPTLIFMATTGFTPPASSSSAAAAAAAAAGPWPDRSTCSSVNVSNTGNTTASEAATSDGPPAPPANATLEQWHALHLVDANGRAVEPRTEAERLVRQAGISQLVSLGGSLAALRFVEYQDPLCHGEGHDLGRGVYEEAVARGEGVDDALRLCGYHCTGGCFHGVTNGYLLGLIQGSSSSRRAAEEEKEGVYTRHTRQQEYADAQHWRHGHQHRRERSRRSLTSAVSRQSRESHASPASRGSPAAPAAPRKASMIASLKQSLAGYCCRPAVLAQTTTGECAHGIGHALVLSGRIGIAEALVWCVELWRRSSNYPKSMAHYCAGGVLMQARMLRHTSHSSTGGGSTSGGDSKEGSSGGSGVSGESGGGATTTFDYDFFRGTRESARRTADRCLDRTVVPGAARAACFYYGLRSMFTQCMRTMGNDEDKIEQLPSPSSSSLSSSLEGMCPEPELAQALSMCDARATLVGRKTDEGGGGGGRRGLTRHRLEDDTTMAAAAAPTEGGTFFRHRDTRRRVTTAPLPHCRSPQWHDEHVAGLEDTHVASRSARSLVGICLRLALVGAEDGGESLRTQTREVRSAIVASCLFGAASGTTIEMPGEDSDGDGDSDDEEGEEEEEKGGGGNEKEDKHESEEDKPAVTAAADSDSGSGSGSGITTPAPAPPRPASKPDMPFSDGSGGGDDDNDDNTFANSLLGDYRVSTLGAMCTLISNKAWRRACIDGGVFRARKFGWSRRLLPKVCEHLRRPSDIRYCIEMGRAGMYAMTKEAVLAGYGYEPGQ